VVRQSESSDRGWPLHPLTTSQRLTTSRLRSTIRRVALAAAVDDVAFSVPREHAICVAAAAAVNGKTSNVTHAACIPERYAPVVRQLLGKSTAGEHERGDEEA
jgi:hypothetical protein